MGKATFRAPGAALGSEEVGAELRLRWVDNRRHAPSPGLALVHEDTEMRFGTSFTLVRITRERRHMGKGTCRTLDAAVGSEVE